MMLMAFIAVGHSVTRVKNVLQEEIKEYEERKQWQDWNREYRDQYTRKLRDKRDFLIRGFALEFVAWIILALFGFMGSYKENVPLMLTFVVGIWTLMFAQLLIRSLTGFVLDQPKDGAQFKAHIFALVAMLTNFSEHHPWADPARTP